MSILLWPVQYAFNKSIEAAFNLDRKAGPRVTAADSQVEDRRDPLRAQAAQTGFKPQYAVPLRPPRNSQEAQRLYNHIRTVAWYLDAIPFFGSRLPFNIGVDSIIGVIPGVGDYIGVILGAYQIFLMALFGVPVFLVLQMILNVVLDCILGLVPILGDALDVAFKANLRNLRTFEDHMCKTGGQCQAGTFALSFPSSSTFIPKEVARAAKAEHAASKSSWFGGTTPKTSNAYMGPGDAGPRSTRSRAAPGAFIGEIDDTDDLSQLKPGDRMGGRVGAMPLALPTSMTRDAEVRLTEAAFEAAQQEPSPGRSQEPAAEVEGYTIGERAPYSAEQRSVSSSLSDESGSEERSDESGSERNSSALQVTMAPSTMTGRPLSVLDTDWIIPNSGSRRWDAHQSGEDGNRSHTRSHGRAGRSSRYAADDDSGVSAPLLSADEHAPNQHLAEPVTKDTRRSSSRTRRPSHAESRQSMQSEAGGFESIPAPPSKSRRGQMFFVVYASIFCVCFFTSLEANMAYLYFNFGLSEFGALASFSTVAIAQQMVFAVAKPPIAKISDTFGRAEAYAFSVALFSLGYVIVATSGGMQQFIGGIVVQSMGSTGLQVLQSIIVADTTSPQYRGLVLAIINVPFLINFAIAGPLVDLVVRNASWRYGFWIWTVVIPLASMPLLLTLAIGQRRASRHHRIHSHAHRSSAPRRSKFARLFAELDFLGLTLLAVGWLLVLLPLTLRDHFATSTAVYLAIGGTTVLLAFLFWETRATIPIVPFRVLSSKPVIYVCLIGLLDFASFTLSWTYVSAFIQILRSWEQTRTAYFATTQNVTSTLMGIIVGYAMSTTRRYKTLMVGGVLVRLVGVGLMIRYRNSHDPTYMLVLCQLLQGVGGGAVAITMQVACQICVRHSDVASVTAFELLTTEIGAAMGSAIAGLLVSGYLPGLLKENLPQLPADEVQRIYGSLQVALDYPLGSDVRTGIINAWVEVMRRICIIATLILIPALFFALAMPNAMLPDHSNHRGLSSHDRRERDRTTGTYSIYTDASTTGYAHANGTGLTASVTNPSLDIHSREPSREEEELRKQPSRSSLLAARK